MVRPIHEVHQGTHSCNVLISKKLQYPAILWFWRCWILPLLLHNSIQFAYQCQPMEQNPSSISV